MIDLSLYGDSPCLVGSDGESFSYSEVDALVSAYASGLRDARGLLILGCRNDIPTVVAYLGALRANCPVMLVDGARDDVIENLAKTFKARYVQNAGGAAPVVREDAATNIHPELALLLLTSGSTGAAKAVRLSQTNVVSNARSIAEYLQLAPDERAALTLPLHYSYGLSVLNSHLSIGASIWLADAPVTDGAFWQDFKRLECTSFPGVPHIYQMLERNGFSSDDFPNLRYATQAGGHLSADLVSYFGQMARRDGWRFYVMYGQTEASPRMSYVPPDLVLKYPDAIGVAIPGGEFRLDRDDALPDGAGELVYSGPNVMMGYAETYEELPLGGGPNELRTGDLAIQNSDGLFKIVGRRSRFIKPFGLRISLDEVERWFAGRSIVAAAVGNDTKLAVFSESALVGDFAGELAAWLKLPPSSVLGRQITKIPRSASGKVDYQSLKRRFEEEDASKVSEKAGPANLTALFEEFFPGASVSESDSFASLGGDSLKFVQFSIELETMFGQLPAEWERLTVGEFRTLLAQQAQSEKPAPSPIIKYLDTGTVLRAYAIICVVTHHLDLWWWTPNGSNLLLVLAGISLGRFQMPEVLRTNQIKGILLSIVRVVIPMTGWVVLNQTLHREPFLPGVFLIGNYWPLKSGFDEWFLEVYIQLFLIIAALLAIPSLRNIMRKAPFASSLGFFVVAMLLQWLLPLVWDASDIDNRVPHMMLWLVASGVMISQANSQITRAIVVLLFCVATYTLMPLLSWTVSMCIGVALVVYVPSLPIPAFLRRPVAEIAAASLFIYLTHFQVAAVVTKLIGFEEPAISVIAALFGGVCVARAYSIAERYIVLWCRESEFMQGIIRRAKAPISAAR
ncbi:AMP-binding protein [Rhizobium sp. BK379]|uniref:AMP-binding protein n=1 Tax=Rhizobium sp. BK379 TaxID=2587059 RepID=UPI00161F62B8|nr:acyl-CoA synthetase (AMP-forming)/AMP-acid ligase II [Rhizobium sp. BK379]